MIYYSKSNSFAKRTTQSFYNQVRMDKLNGMILENGFRTSTQYYIFVYILSNLVITISIFFVPWVLLASNKAEKSITAWWIEWVIRKKIITTQLDTDGGRWPLSLEFEDQKGENHLKKEIITSLLTHSTIYP